MKKLVVIFGSTVNLTKRGNLKSPPCFLMSDFYANNPENQYADNFFNHEIKTLFFRRYQVDVSRKEQVEELANKIQSEVGDVNILVNNAGVLYCRPFVQWTPNQIEQVVQTNLMGKIYLLPSKS